MTLGLHTRRVDGEEPWIEVKPAELSALMWGQSAYAPSFLWLAGEPGMRLPPSTVVWRRLRPRWACLDAVEDLVVPYLA